MRSGLLSLTLLGSSASGCFHGHSARGQRPVPHLRGGASIHASKQELGEMTSTPKDRMQVLSEDKALSARDRRAYGKKALKEACSDNASFAMCHQQSGSALDLEKCLRQPVLGRQPIVSPRCRNGLQAWRSLLAETSPMERSEDLVVKGPFRKVETEDADVLQQFLDWDGTLPLENLDDHHKGGGKLHSLRHDHSPAHRRREFVADPPVVWVDAPPLHRGRRFHHRPPPPGHVDRKPHEEENVESPSVFTVLADWIFGDSYSDWSATLPSDSSDSSDSWDSYLQPWDSADSSDSFDSSDSSDSVDTASLAAVPTDRITLDHLGHEMLNPGERPFPVASDGIVHSFGRIDQPDGLHKLPHHGHSQGPPHGHHQGPPHGHHQGPPHGHHQGPPHGHPQGPAHGHHQGPPHGHPQGPPHGRGRPQHTLEDLIVINDANDARHSPKSPHGQLHNLEAGQALRHHERRHVGGDHLRNRNRLPDDYENIDSWFDDGFFSEDGPGLVEGILAFFFFIGAFTLLLLPFFLLGRALRKMVRQAHGSASDGADAPDGYRALSDDDDEDSVVVTGTPVNPPPSVHL